MNSFIERLNWLIDNLADGKPYRFAKKAGIESGTFQPYIKKGRVPKIEQLLCIRSTYGINLNWLLAGVGEPFDQAQGDGNLSTQRDPESNELLLMTAEILAEHSDYSVSLAANIRSFHAAVTTERRLEAVEAEVADIKVLIRIATDRLRDGDPEEKKDEILQKRAISSG